MSRAWWHVAANAPTVVWLFVLVVVSFGHREIPQSGWLMFHLLFLGAASNAILVWSCYFTETLLRLPPTAISRSGQAMRLVAMNLGAVFVMGGLLTRVVAVAALGGIVVAGVAASHAHTLWSARRNALASRFSDGGLYYVASALFLVVGAGLGAWMAATGAPAHLLVAHVMANLLGWIGLTVAGTITTLLPTAMRTRLPVGAEAASRRGFTVLLAGLSIGVAAAAGGWAILAAAGVAVYASGWVVIVRPLIPLVRQAAAARFAPASLMAGCAWLVVSLAAWAVVLATQPGWPEVAEWTGRMAVPLASGFVIQVLLGALTYLVPVVLGGGPTRVRESIRVMEAGATVRVTVANLGLLVCLLPVPSLVRVAASIVVLVAYAVFIPLVIRTVWRRFRRDVPPPRGSGSRNGQQAGAADTSRAATSTTTATATATATTATARTRGGLVVGVAVMALVVAGATAADPGSAARNWVAAPAASVDAVAATGQTTTVAVEAGDMEFIPNVIDVPIGNVLIIDLVNVDDNVHDLVLSNGVDSGRIGPGQSARVEAGVIGADLAGVCSIVGHQQMGMTLTIKAIGAESHSPDSHSPGAGSAGHDSAGHSGDGGDARIDFHAAPPPDFQAFDARLRPAPDRRVHRVTIRAEEVERSVAPGVTQRLWTYNGTMPGPTLRGKVGDVFDVTFINDGTMGHSIDFHASSVAPDRPMRTIAPGESLRYRFTAGQSGIWMYHCGTMPMSAHIANGMFGAVIIDPPDLAPVDREFLLVQSELYLGPPAGEVSMDSLEAESASAVVFNGYANQYVHRPLNVGVGERIRIWVLDAGPNRPSSFHVVGGQFDTVFFEGSLTLTPGRDGPGGSQALALAASQGGYVELALPQAGHYPFVSHIMWDAEHGATGILRARRR